MNEPAGELHALTHALRRHVRRRQILGDRRAERWVPDINQEAQPPATPASPATPVSPATPASPAPRSAAPQASPAAPAPAASPRETPPDTWPADWGTTPDHKDESERRTALLRERATACPDLPSLQVALSTCTACTLCQSRTQTVFMDGSGPARVMFVGEAPGFHEDRTGVPFVGPAGALLSDIIEKGMGLDRSEVVIANVLKCRPPENRDPLPAEKRLCTTWLDRQIELVNPEVLIALGRHAAGHLLENDSPMSRLRGRVWLRQGRKVVATYHPAYLLRSPGEKKEAWKDIQLAMAELGLEGPGRGR